MVNLKAMMIGLLIILSSCEMVVDYQYHSGLQFQSNEDVMAFVYNYIESVPEKEGDDWQTPEETMQKRSGDCEDFAILMLALSGESFGIYGDLVGIKLYSGYHGVAKIAGVYYDPSFNTIREEVEIVGTCSYEEAITTAELWK